MSLHGSKPLLTSSISLSVHLPPKTNQCRRSCHLTFTPFSHFLNAFHSNLSNAPIRSITHFLLFMNLLVEVSSPPTLHRNNGMFLSPFSVYFFFSFHAMRFSLLAQLEASGDQASCYFYLLHFKINSKISFTCVGIENTYVKDGIKLWTGYWREGVRGRHTLKSSDSL